MQVSQSITIEEARKYLWRDLLKKAMDEDRARQAVFKIAASITYPNDEGPMFAIKQGQADDAMCDYYGI